LTRYVVDQEQYVVRVPREAADLAVFAEPVSIAEKAIEQIKIIQARLPWTCPHPDHGFTSDSWGTCLNALIVGAGPLGLLATALLRLHDVNTWTTDIVPEDHIKAIMVKRLGATYADARNKGPQDLVQMCSLGSSLNIIIDASGAADTALELINHLARSSIYVMTGIPREGLLTQVDAAEIVRQIVRKNEVIVGSVNSNRSHFEMALRDIPRLASKFEGVLREMVTNRYAIEDFAKAFADSDPKHIKTVLDVQP
jgi:threonine dehydrogenase-like Zn-dependent dehydrogenase